MLHLIALMLATALSAQEVRFVGKSKYLHNARAVVVHSIDDSTKHVSETIDAMDRYDSQGLKCAKCGRIYPIRDDIPVMRIEEARIEESWTFA